MKNSVCREGAAMFYALTFLFAPFSTAFADDLETLMDWLEGDYSNQLQVDTGVMDAESNLLFPVFRKVDIPAFGDHVIYLQWPIGSSDGRLQRQRIWAFAADDMTGALSMDFFTLKQPDEWLDAHLDPEKVKNMTMKDVIGYPKSCLLPVTFNGDRFVARIPIACVIVSQSTRTSMTLQSETIISADQLSYQEAGVRDNGAVVFQVPPSGRYVFERLAD